MNPRVLFIFCILTQVSCAKGRYGDLFQTVPEIISAHGYPVEVHHVRTADGYILELHRIPHRRDRPYRHSLGSPVLVMHGLLDSSASWVINPRQSLGFALADEGYDVWLGNNRGNRYSRRHAWLNPNKRRFWDFTSDAYAQHDNPAMIDYILQVTRYRDLFYIGHSMGTWSFWAMMNFYPWYNDRIRLMVALAPVSTRIYGRSITRLLVPFRRQLSKTSNTLGVGETLRYRQVNSLLGKMFCGKHSLTAPMCALVLFMLAGWDPKQLDKASLPRIFAHVPAGAGTKVLKQTAQQIASGEFEHYNYGKKRNMAIYGQWKPPRYYPEMVKAPVVLIWGANDKLADERDVAMLEQRLPNLVASEPVRWPLWSHFDFLWGIDAGPLVYRRVLFHMGRFGGPHHHKYPAHGGGHSHNNDNKHHGPSHREGGATYHTPTVSDLSDAYLAANATSEDADADCFGCVAFDDVYSLVGFVTNVAEASISKVCPECQAVVRKKPTVLNQSVTLS